MSFGWGIASYSFAMRLISKNAEKGKLGWAGYILQSIWRFGMLSARIIALVLLSLALGQWTVVVMCKYNNSCKSYLTFKKASNELTF